MRVLTRHVCAPMNLLVLRGGYVGQEVEVADNYLVAFEDEAVRHFGSHWEGRYISRRSRHVWVVARLALISGI